MDTKNINTFRGEIENYLGKDQNNFDSKIDEALTSLNIKTILCQAGIIKKDGVHAAQIFFILLLLPMLSVKTVHSFCGKSWKHWSECGKDVFYRFRQKDYRWRTFMYKFNLRLFGMLEIEDIPREDRYFVIDDTVCMKMGKMMENVSYIFDHNLGRSILGYCIVTLGILAGNGFYPIDFAYRFGKKRRVESPENIGNPKSISGQRSYEAKHHTKPELAIMMIRNAVSYGICPGYVLFDSWFAWPSFILAIRDIGDKSIHVICRLKNNNVKYSYKGKKYKLKELYGKVKSNFKKDKKTGLLLARIRVRFPDSEDCIAIVFSKNYCEPEESVIKGVKKKKNPKWVAFLSTNPNLHSSTIIEKYTKRWSVEVCFKECKQMLSLGKDQSNNFNAQVFSTTISFIRYNLLNYLNENENHATLGILFEHLKDDYAVISYSQRLWEFFREFFMISFKSLFNIFEIHEDSGPYFDTLCDAVCRFIAFNGCET